MESESESVSDSSPSSPFRRTVDDILNEHSSSSSPSPPSSPLAHPKPSPPPPPQTAPSAPPKLTSASSLPLRSQSINPRSLPSLFDRVRPNPRPGAALAAAAAASRSVLTPHAAAIKSWRALNRGKPVEVARDAALLRSISEVVLEPVAAEDRVVVVDEKREDGEELAETCSLDSGVEVVARGDGEGRGSACPIGDAGSVCSPSMDSVPDAVEDELKSDLDSHSLVQENEADDIGDWGPAAADDSRLQVHEDEVDHIENSENGEKEMGSSGEEERGKSDVSPRDVEIPEMGTTKSSCMADSKLQVAMKPLECAEELEKRQASSGLHWEEGAMAQPMRLKGIGRGPPAVGYLQIEGDNAITRAISSQTVRTNHGSPQALAVHMSYIAVGMSKGSVLVVPSRYSAHSADTMDSKMLVLSTQSDRSPPPVTSLCFNQQGDMLLVGYGNGHVILWDVQKATAAKVITGEHSGPVVHISFLGEDSQITRQFKAITGDSKGFILLHSFSWGLFNLYSVKSQRCVDGKKSGTAISVSPLFVGTSSTSGMPTSQGNPVVSTSGLGSMMGSVVGGKLFVEGMTQMEEGVVIFISHKQALVARLTPTFELYDTLPKPDGIREGSIPYSAWKCAPLSRVSSKDESDSGIPWLVIAWDRKIQVFKLVKTKLEKYREWNLDSPAIGVCWLDDQVLVVLTLRGQLCLFSKDATKIYQTNISLDDSGGNDAIAYHTHFINGFGNPEKAYHNSFAVRGATAYILGSSRLMISRLLPWKERIQVLQRAGDWMSALDMAMRLYDGQAHGVIDLPRSTDEIRKMIMPYLIELLHSYVDEVFSYISVAFSNQLRNANQHDEDFLGSSSSHEELDEQFARVGGVAVEFCLHIKRTDILFEDIFSKFVAVHHGGTFLEVLEPYILKDMLGCLPPEIMKALVEHYSCKGWLQRVEQCVLHMEISSLDFNQIIRLCREHGLYGALIYLFNKGLDDYNTPLEELFAVVKNLQRADAITIGYRVLVYLKYCFLGLAFPPGHGNIAPSRWLSLREELLQFLLNDSHVAGSPVTSAFKTSCGICPNLWYLLWLDSDATLEVLRLAFLDDKVLPGDFYSQNVVDSGSTTLMEDSPENSASLNMVQDTVNSLIYCLDLESEIIRSVEIDNNGFVEIWPSKKAISHMVDFISFFTALKKAVISQPVLKHILAYLAVSALSCGEDYQEVEASKKQKQVLSLLNALPEKDWNDSSILNIFIEAQYYQVCGLIQTIRGLYVESLESYMKDMKEPAHTFAFIHKMMLQLKEPESSSLRAAVISRLPELIKISREGTFFLVLDHFSEDAPQILSELQSNPESLFLFLKAAVEVHLQEKLNFSALEKSCASSIPFVAKVRNSSNDLEAYLERLSDFPKLIRHNPFSLTDELAELYLKLLCQYESRSVLKFLNTFENYSLEHCLRLCQDHGITDAASFLLERAGDIGGALVQATSGLSEKISLIAISVQNTLQGMTKKGILDFNQIDIISSLDEVTDVHDVLSTSIGLCQRNTHRLNPHESESLWFQLLDRFSEPLRRLFYDKGVRERKAYATSPITFNVQERIISKTHSILKAIFSQFVKEIVEGMIGYIPLPAIMSKLLGDNGDQEFGDYKFTVLGMLGTHGFERRILDTAKLLIEDDTFHTMSMLKKGASHAYSPQSFICCICSCSLSKDSTSSSIRIFSCGHATHLHCESLENETSESIRLAGCPICMPKKKITRHKTKSSLVDNGLIRNSATGGRSRKSSKHVQHFLEPEQIEKPYGTHQVPRFEILNHLRNGQRSFQVDSIPQLRLAPPAMYHEKVQKGTASLVGESSSSLVKSERGNRRRQHSQSNSKGFSKHFPLKASIFGSEKIRSAQRHNSRS